MNILSCMPIYHERNIVRWLLLHESDALAQMLARLVERLRVAGEQLDYVVLPAGDDAMREQVEQLLAETGPKLCFAPSHLGFVCTNESALLRVTQGEMPVPQQPRLTVCDVKTFSIPSLWADEYKHWCWIDPMSAPALLDKGETVAKACELAHIPDPKAVYLGHPYGTFIAGSDLTRDVGDKGFAAPIPIDCEYIHIFTRKDCMAKALAEVCERHHLECCGRCVFGHEGSYQAQVITNDIINKRGRHTDAALLGELAPAMADQSACELGVTLARSVQTAFAHFGQEIEAHVTKKQCPAGECAAYRSYYIIPASCIGCCECVDACEEDAIMSKKGFVHVIDQKACTACGACVAACDEGAIVAAGAEKPRIPPRPIPCKRR